jgi:phage protein D
MFMIIINNPYSTSDPAAAPWKHMSKFAIGKTIKIGFTSSTTESPVFTEALTEYVMEGEITAIETEFNIKNEAPITIRGYDKSHRLHRGRFNRSFLDVKDSDLVTRLAGGAGVTTGTVTATTTTHKYVFQENQTNMEFLQERAARKGFELYMQDGKLNFRKPTKDSELTLKWLEDIYNFRVRATSAEQVKSVEVRGWNYETKEAIVSTASSETAITSNDSGKGSQKGTVLAAGDQKMIVVDQPVFSVGEADAIAKVSNAKVSNAKVLKAKGFDF